MSKTKYFAALYTSRIIGVLLKLMKKNIPYYPGLIANRICKNLIEVSPKPGLVIGVTGTNGKTTVTNIVADFYRSIGMRVCTNNGYNTPSGISSSLLKDTSLFGRCRSDVAVFEVDERSSEAILPMLKLDYLVVTNLFRDSMAHNANVEFILNLLKENINPETQLILNADDIISTQLDVSSRAIYYSLKKCSDNKATTKDICYCPRCDNELTINYLNYNHIGSVRCEHCGFGNNDAKYVGDVDFDRNLININGTEYKLISDSIFNVYNMLSAVSLLLELGFDSCVIRDKMKDVRIVGSRFNTQKIGEYNMTAILAKGQNSVACSTVFDYVSRIKGEKTILMMLDDYTSNMNETETMSWIYDSDFECLNRNDISSIIVGGIRSYDYKLRLLMAGVPDNKIKICKSETGMVELLDYSNEKNIYLLFDVFAIERADVIKKEIIKRIKEVQ